MADATPQSHYDRLSHHFQACLELPAADRTRYVSQVAATDPDFEKELRSLLHYHETSSISSPTSPAPIAAPSAKAPGAETRSRGRSRSRLRVPLLILGIKVVALGVILGVQAWALTTLERSLKDQTASNMKAAVDLRVSNLRGWAAGLKQQCARMLEDPELSRHVQALLEASKNIEGQDAVRAALAHHPAAAPLARRLLEPRSELNNLGFSILSASGLCLASEYEPLIGQTVTTSGAAYVGRIQMGEILVSRPYPNRYYASNEKPEFSKPVMFVGGPIRDAAGRLVALGFFRFSPTRFYEILSSANAEFLAFDAKGLVLSPLKDPAQEPFRTSLREPGASAPERWTPTMMSLLAAEGHDGMDADGHPDQNGRKVLAAWVWLPEWEMGIGGQIPVDRVLAPAAAVRTAFSTLLGVFLALTAGVAGLLGIRWWRGKESPFGAYRVEKRIGKGGMAEVFLARHEILRRPAALKILSGISPDAPSVERFKREARLACTLSHPNTIQVFDFGETPDGRLYYAMEHVEGLTLAQLIALDGPPPLGRAIHFLRQVAGSLGDAHRAGLLHRDLKPSNIMVTSRGGTADLVKVLDFGIACSLTPGDEDQTRATALIGTPAFLAPERILDPRTLDPRSDVYSFGAVAFYLATGRHVFEGSNPAELIYQVISSPRPSPSRLRGAPLPEALETLILGCLSPDPQSRPAGMTEIVEILDTLALSERWTAEMALGWWSVNRERVADFIHAAR